MLYWSDNSVFLQILCFALESVSYKLQIFCVSHRNKALVVGKFKSIMWVSTLILLSWSDNR